MVRTWVNVHKSQFEFSCLPIKLFCFEKARFKSYNVTAYLSVSLCMYRWDTQKNPYKFSIRTHFEGENLINANEMSCSSRHELFRVRLE